VLGNPLPWCSQVTQFESWVQKHGVKSDLLTCLWLDFLFLYASNTDWPYWCFVAGMTWLQSTWQETFNGPPIQNLDSVSVRHPVSNWSYQGPDFSLSATVLVPLLLVSGTVYLRQWPLLKHSIALRNIKNPFISLFLPFIVTLLRLSFCCRVLAAFSLRHVKYCRFQ